MSNQAYPALFLGKDSKRTTRDGRNEDVLGDGSTRIRKLYADKFDFDIVHPSVPLADTGSELGVATLQTFYDAYGTDPVLDFTWLDGTVYQVAFGKGGLDIQPVTPLRRDVHVRLVGV